MARKWTIRRENESIIQAAESETKLGAEILKKLTPHYGTTELFPEDDFYGYAWYVTKGDWVNIGIGRFNHRTHNLNTHLDSFMNKLRGLGRLDGIENKMTPFGRHAYKLYDEIPRQKSGDRFLLVGDSAGFASKWAGEGIKPAVQTGLFAAQTADLALKSGDFSAAFLNRYTDLCESRYGKQRNTLMGSLLSYIPERLTRKIVRQICVRDTLRKKLIFEAAFGFETTSL